MNQDHHDHSPQDLLAIHYPGAIDVIRIHEEDRHRGIIDAMIFQPAIRVGASPEQLLRIMKESADRLIATVPGPLSKPGVREQMDHPDFLRYLRAKLGAM